MSKELAEKMDVDGSEKCREEFEALMKNSCFEDMDKEELDKRIERARNGEYIPQEVSSWGELWEEY